MISTQAFTVEQELILTEEMHRLPPLPQLVEAFGFDVSTPPEQLLLAQVVISAASYGGNWKVFALVNDVTVGVIWCKPGTIRGVVLDVVDEWIRASDHIIFVPGKPIEIPVNPQDSAYIVAGMTLIRGDKL